MPNPLDQPPADSNPPPLPGVRFGSTIATGAPPPIPGGQQSRSFAPDTSPYSVAKVTAITGTAGCAVVANLTSGLPGFIGLLMLAIVGLLFVFKSSVALYLPLAVTAGARVIPFLQVDGPQPNLYPLDFVHIASVVGWMACGLTFLELVGPTTAAWHRRLPREGDAHDAEAFSRTIEATGRRFHAIAPWLPLACVAIFSAVVLSYAFPLAPRFYSANNFKMTPEGLRLTQLILIISLPVWFLSTLLGLIAWRRHSAIQARVFLLRELFEAGGKEASLIEKRARKLRLKHAKLANR